MINNPMISTPSKHSKLGALRSRGASLIELMIAMTIGLVVALIVVATVTGVGASFRTIGSNASAQVSAQVGLGLIDEAGRSAGAGFYSNGQIICPSINAWASGVTRLNDATLMPVRIIDGGLATASDTIVFTTSAGVGPLSSMPVMVNMATAGEDITVNDSGLIAANDLAVVGSPTGGGPCTLFQVTATPVPSVACGGNATTCKVLPRATNPSTGYNPPVPAAAFAAPTAYGFSTAGGAIGPSTVARIGATFRQPAFTVQCESLVAYNAFTDVPTCTTNPLSFAGGGNALASDIVLMHAQYGISPDAVSDEVTSWVEATGADWAAPTPANVQRIKAIRIIVISRAKEAASTGVITGACTNAAGVVNVGPCSFQDAAAPVIDLSGTAVVAGRTWQNYRYRVHRAVIPLRNVLWSN